MVLIGVQWSHRIIHHFRHAFLEHRLAPGRRQKLRGAAGGKQALDLRRERLLGVHLERGERSGVAGNAVREAAQRAAEHQAAQTCGMVERELLRDHAAHRYAHDVRTLDARVVEHAGRVGRHVGHRERLFGLIAFACAAVVDQDGPEAR